MNRISHTHRTRTVLICALSATALLVSAQIESRSGAKITPAELSRQLEQVKPSEQELAAAKRAGIGDLELVNFILQLRTPPERVDLSKPLFTPGALPNFKVAGTGPCPNGGFELGNFTNWSGATGTFNVMGAFSAAGFVTTSTPPTSRHTILPATGFAAWNGPTDPTVNAFAGIPSIPLPFPNGGTRWMRLGNTSVGAQAEGITRSFIITPANARFGFEYAIVCQDPNGHTAAQKPRLIYQLTVSGAGVVDSFDRFASSADSFWNIQPNAPVDPVLWRRISCRIFDLSAYIGQTATVTFINKDCSLGAHFGYTYLDRFCDPNVGRPVLDGLKASYCETDAIMADGTKTSGETQHTWTVSRLDGAGNPIANTTKNQTYSGESTAPINLNPWYTGKGGFWLCGWTYRITLAINTECSTNEKVSRDIKIECCEGCCTKAPVKFTEPYIKLRPSTTHPGGFDTALSMTWPGARKRVEVSIVNVLRKTMPNGSTHRSFGFFRGAAPSLTGPAMTPVQPNLLYPWIARWESNTPAASGASAIFPMTMQFSPPVPNQTSYLRFTLMARAYDADCQACDVQQTFSFKFDGTQWAPIQPNEWPSRGVLDGNSVISGLTIEGIKEILNPGPRRAQAPPAQGGVAKVDLNPFPPLIGGVWTSSVLNCCNDQFVRALRADLRAGPTSMATGNWVFSPTITSNINPASRVEVAILNSAAAAPMGQTYPTPVSLNSASVVGGMPPQYGALPFSHLVRWQFPAGINLTGGVNFPMMVQLPKPPPNGTIFVHFTVRYTVFTQNCRPCDTYQQFFVKIVAGQLPVNVNPKEWPIKTDGPPDNGSGGSTKRSGGGVLMERR